MDSTPRITIIGTGYVGLVTGTCFADMGFHVTCMDIDAEKIRKLDEESIIPIYEPGLEELVKKNQELGRLHFTTDLASCVPTSDAIFIAVGTPQDEDGSADLQYVFAAARDIAPHLSGYTVVVNKSTVPVGTGAATLNVLRETNPKADVDVCSNPEFLREGCAVHDVLNPDRIVVGASSVRSLAVMRALYTPQTRQGVPMVESNLETSELTKYAANAFLATKITFINEVAALCDNVGADVMRVAQGMGLDKRIGNLFLNPGPGYGGSCFPKDTNAMAKTARDYNAPLSLVEATIKSNDAIKQGMATRIETALGGDVNGKTIAILGLAFKADTDDMRDAVALDVLPTLAQKGATLHAYDPEAFEQAQWRLEGTPVTYCQSLEEACKGADCVAILTEWGSFKTMDLGALKATMNQPVMVDLRNLFSPKEMVAAGWTYHCLGRPTQSQLEITDSSAA